MQPPVLSKPVPARPKVRRQRIGIRVPQPVLHRLREFVAALGATESDVITKWVAERLDEGGVRHTEGSKATAMDGLVKALNAERAARAVEHRELVGALELQAEAFGRFVGLWLAANPLPADAAPHLQRSEAEYGRFARWVFGLYERGHRFASHWPKDAPAKPQGSGRGQSGGSPSGAGGGTL